MTRLFVYEFEHNGCYDWVLGHNKPEAIREHNNNTGGEAIIDGYNIRRMTDEETKKAYLLDIDKPEPDDDEEYNQDEYNGGYKIIDSFYNVMRDRNDADYLATTEF